jgi:ABC-type spermidine/putrescine transport system permease subunit II
MRKPSWLWRPVMATQITPTPMIVPVILIAIGVFYAYVQLKLVNSLLGLVLAVLMVVMVVGSALKFSVVTAGVLAFPELVRRDHRLAVRLGRPPRHAARNRSLHGYVKR